MNILALAIAAPILAGLTKGPNKRHYPSLNTTETDIEKWWDSLDWSNKVDVGGFAVHVGKLNPNHAWDCGYQDRRRKHTPFKDLPAKQKRTIKYCFSLRNDKHMAVDIRSFKL